MKFEWNDALWVFNYPTQMLLAALLFFVPLKKAKKGIYFFVASIVSIYLLALVRHFIPNHDGVWSIPYYFLIFAVIYLGCRFSFANVTWTSSLFLAAMIIAMQHLSHKIADELYILIDINLVNTRWMFLIDYVTQLLVEVLFYFFYVKRVPEKIQAENSRANIIGVSLLLVFSVVINTYTYPLFFMDIPNGKLISALVNLSEIVITLLIIAFLYTSAITKRVQEENAMLKVISSKERERYELAKITIDEINIKYHDLKHALKKGNLDEGEEKEIKETLTNYKTIVQTSNRGLNVVIYEYQLKCISKDIELNALIDGDPLNFMKSHHVYSLLSNLIDNSIEAVEKLDKEHRRIFLKINRVGGYTIIIVSNYTNKPVEVHGLLAKTTKKDAKMHGYGMRSIKQVVERYDGEMSLENKDGTFITKIMIPNE